MRPHFSPVDHQFPSSEPLLFWPFFGNRETVRIRLYYRGRPLKKQQTRRENYMKKLLLIALVVSGFAFVPVQRSDAQVSVGIGFGYPAYRYHSYGYGYPGYGYGYYPYGYYQSYPSYGYYTGPSYYWSGGRRVYYRHHRHHYYRHGY